MPLLASRTSTGERYATQMGELWGGLTWTLARLDELAAEPERLDDGDTLEVLRRLQYTLHTAGERIYGLAPPAGAEPAHGELGAALAGARDITAEVLEALEEEDLEAAGRLVHEWRGALFRVRLARLRLLGPRRHEPPEKPRLRRELRAPLLALALFSAGAAAFVFGATAGRWPLWLAGMLAVCGSAVAYRP
jgi:hypothetical protein